MKRYADAVVIGGSGMLAGCCRELLNICDKVSVVARNEHRVRAIDPAIYPIVADYTDSAGLAAAHSWISAPDLVVAWVHGRLPVVRRSFAERVQRGGRFVHVLGSAHGDPSHPERVAEMAQAVEGLPISYQAAVLGFVIENGRSRWLTNDEISSGVFAAIQSGAPLSIIGTVEPWPARP